MQRSVAAAMAVDSTPMTALREVRYCAPEMADVKALRHRPWSPKRRPTLLEWSEARRLHHAGTGVRAIARSLKLSQRTVRQILYPWPRA
jgi:DNA-binding NarL/FixJ family response regulator